MYILVACVGEHGWEKSLHVSPPLLRTDVEHCIHKYSQQEQRGKLRNAKQQLNQTTVAILEKKHARKGSAEN